MRSTVGYSAEGTTTCLVILFPLISDENTGKVTSPAVRLSPNARNFVFDSVGSLETFTANEHVAVRLSESVAVQLTVVVPIGKVVPGEGSQVTLTVPCPSVAEGMSKLIASPPAFTVERARPSIQDSDGGLATGGGGGGGGVGVVGVL